MVFPVTYTPSVIASLSRFLLDISVGAKRRVEMWSTSILLISSGIDMSKLLRPASTCATGICSLAAARAPARVVFVSPWTITMSGFSLRRTFSMPVSIFAVCSAWVPEPTSRLYLGSGSCSCWKNMRSMLYE